MTDRESNRFSARAARYARVGANVGGVAARIAGARLMGGGNSDSFNAAALTKALGGLKGPIMKMAQLFATVPELLPPEYAEALQSLQSDAPPMGAAFVKRRMQAELGADWQTRFGSFDLKPAAAASLGQVHRAEALDGTPLACKLQYPDMSSAVEADIRQLEILLSVHRRMGSGIDTREIVKEVSERVREELDYGREAKHAALYRLMLAEVPAVTVPDVHPDLSTNRLLTMGWLEGRKLLDFREADLETRNRIAVAMFKAWWVPFCHYGVIHGDPHLGNYTIRQTDGVVSGVNLLDYGCIRIFPATFVAGVVDLYTGLLENDAPRVKRAYDSWGFRGLKPELLESLNIWARFIYGPIMDDRVRTVADGVAPGQYGRREAFQVHRVLKEKGPITIPREFVFMDRAAVGLGSVFLHLGAEMNFAKLFQETIADFDIDIVAARQAEALRKVGLAGSEAGRS